MKKLILGLLVTFFLVPAIQGVPQAQEDITLDEFLQICEEDFFSCYDDAPEGKAKAEEAIATAQSVPPHLVAPACADFCNSDPIDGQGALRNTINCTDEQCENRCTALSGILDDEIMQLIDMMDFEALNALCPLPEPTPEPVVSPIPTFNQWGFISLAVVLALVGLGAILVRRRKVRA